MPPAPPPPPPKPLTRPGVAAVRGIMGAALATFCVACFGLFLLTGERERWMERSGGQPCGLALAAAVDPAAPTPLLLLFPPPLLSIETGMQSELRHTPLGAALLRALASNQFLIGAAFNISLFSAVLAYARLREHANALQLPPPLPGSRQERRAGERAFRDALRDPVARAKVQ